MSPRPPRKARESWLSLSALGLWITTSAACQSPPAREVPAIEPSRSGDLARGSSENLTSVAVHETVELQQPQQLRKGKRVPPGMLPPLPSGANQGLADATLCPNRLVACFVAWGKLADPNFVILLRDLDALVHYYGNNKVSARAVVLDESEPSAAARRKTRVDFALAWQQLDPQEKALAWPDEPTVALVQNTGEILELGAAPRDYLAFDREVAAVLKRKN